MNVESSEKNSKDSKSLEEQNTIPEEPFPIEEEQLPIEEELFSVEEKQFPDRTLIDYNADQKYGQTEDRRRDARLKTIQVALGVSGVTWIGLVIWSLYSSNDGEILKMALASLIAIVTTLIGTVIGSSIDKSSK